MLRRPFSAISVRDRRKAKKRRDNVRGRLLSIEPLEDRRLLALTSPPNQSLPLGSSPLDVRMGHLNQDSFQDLAAINADGSLTVALNRGDDQWLSAETTTLGVGPLNGMELAFINGGHNRI